jgi:hypothetical protein
MLVEKKAVKEKWVNCQNKFNVVQLALNEIVVRKGE